MVGESSKGPEKREAGVKGVKRQEESLRRRKAKTRAADSSVPVDKPLLETRGRRMAPSAWNTKEWNLKM